MKSTPKSCRSVLAGLYMHTQNVIIIGHLQFLFKREVFYRKQIKEEKVNASKALLAFGDYSQ